MMCIVKHLHLIKICIATSTQLYGQFRWGEKKKYNILKGELYF